MDSQHIVKPIYIIFTQVFGIGVGIGRKNVIAQTAIKEIGGLKEFPNNHAFVNDHSELEASKLAN